MVLAGETPCRIRILQYHVGTDSERGNTKQEEGGTETKGEGETWDREREGQREKEKGNMTREEGGGGDRQRVEERKGATE